MAVKKPSAKKSNNIFGRKTVIAVSLIVIAYLVNNYLQDAANSPVVRTKYGRFIGSSSLSRNGREYSSFLGLRYALAPVAELRFEPPQPYVEKWDGYRMANSYGAFCLQFDLLTKNIGGEEDCLFLNVFKPKNVGENGKLVPAIVFFHGGAFVSGNSNRYNPKYFMDEDVLFVSVNYRLGALGFLNTGDSTVRGNMGLKDQNLALKWVKENIRSFGGDPDQVTILGNSAGGASVHYHMISPLSKGLFRAGISQSGSAISHWATFPKPREQAQRFAAQLNCPTKNSVEMVACLKKVEPLDLVEIHKEIMVPLRDLITIFVPTVEANPDGDSFLTKEPEELIKSGNINKVPWITGANKDEGLFFSGGIFRNDSMLQRLRNDFHDVISKLMDISPVKESKKLYQLKKFYITDNQLTPELYQYTDLFSDRSFIYPSHKSAEMQSTHSPVYSYHYAYKRENSLANIIFALKGNYPAIVEITLDVVSTWIKRNLLRMEVPSYGVCHADELGMLFPVLWDSEITPGSRDYQMSVEVVKLWVDFAYGRPLKIGNTTWEPVDPKAKSQKYLRLDTVSSMVEPPFQARMDLWDSFGKVSKIHDK